jgi:hypothetical protein
VLTGAVERDPAWTTCFARAIHLTPRFAIDVADRPASCALGEKIDLLVQFSYGNWDDVPEVFRDDVDGDKVDLTGGIAAIVASAFDGVMRIHKAAGGFDLDSPELMAGVDDEIVALAVSPGSGDAKTEA